MQPRLARFAHRASPLTVVAGLAFAMTAAFAAGGFPSGTYASVGLSATFEGSHFRIKQGETVQVEGDYAVHADRIELTDRRGPWACTKKGEETGAYQWKYDGGTLTFSDAGDRCKARSGSLTAQAWKKA